MKPTFEEYCNECAYPRQIVIGKLEPSMYHYSSGTGLTKLEAFTMAAFQGAVVSLGDGSHEWLLKEAKVILKVLYDNQYGEGEGK